MIDASSSHFLFFPRSENPRTRILPLFRLGEVDVGFRGLLLEPGGLEIGALFPVFADRRGEWRQASGDSERFLRGNAKGALCLAEDGDPLGLKRFSREERPLCVHERLGRVEGGEFTLGGAFPREFGEFLRDARLPGAQGALLVDRDQLHDEGLGLGDEAPLGVAHLKRGGADHLGGKFLFEFEAIGQGKDWSSPMPVVAGLRPLSP